MKTRLLTIIAGAMLFTACASKESRDLGNAGGTPPPAPGAIPPPPGGTVPPPPGGTTTTGAEAPFDGDVSTEAFELYTGRVPNNPTDWKLHLDMRNVSSTGEKRYGGSIKISYTENGTRRESTFQSGTSSTEVQFNKFVTHSGQEVYKAFFEDHAGAVIIVADDKNDLGLWSGRIYFSNFTCVRDPWDPPCNWYKPTRCWLIGGALGGGGVIPPETPYDCRAFLALKSNGEVDWGSTINTSRRLNPTSNEGYIELGRFKNLELNKALRQ